MLIIFDLYLSFFFIGQKDVKHFVCLSPIATREQMWKETMNLAFLNSNNQTILYNNSTV